MRNTTRWFDMESEKLHLVITDETFIHKSNISAACGHYESGVLGHSLKNIDQHQNNLCPNCVQISENFTDMIEIKEGAFGLIILKQGDLTQRQLFS